MDDIIRKYKDFSGEELIEMLESGDVSESEEYIVITMANKSIYNSMSMDESKAKAKAAIDTKYLKSMNNRFVPF